MSLKCKKCGCDALIKTDDWYKCAQCGAVIFDTDITVNDITSPTKAMEKMESEPIQAQTARTVHKEQAVSVEQTAKSSGEKEQNASQPTENNAPSSKRQEQKHTKKEKKPKKSKKKDEAQEEDAPPKSKTREAIEFFIPIVVAVVVAIILKSCVFANAVVPTGSMLNTIQEGDRIIASRLAYKNEAPQRYDIIIFHYPDNEKEYYVKRIIGLPGETVQVVDGDVYVTKTDGETIILDDSFVTNCEPQGNYGPYQVPEDAYFVMGDNRNDSWDSRFWDNTFVYRDKIVGKVKFRYYPSIEKIE